MEKHSHRIVSFGIGNWLRGVFIDERSGSGLRHNVDFVSGWDIVGFFAGFPDKQVTRIYW